MRVTYITTLQRSGLLPSEVQALARHRDPKLTSRVYTDQKLIDTFQACQVLPDYEFEPQGNAEAPSGDHTKSMKNCRPLDQKLDQTARISGPSRASGGTQPVRSDPRINPSREEQDRSQVSVPGGFKPPGKPPGTSPDLLPGTGVEPARGINLTRPST